MIHTFLRTLIIIGVLFSFGTPSTQAYFTTHQEATPFLGEHSALFRIDYSFGSPKREVLLPIAAAYSDAKQNDMVSFSILDEAGNTVSGKTAAIVLSNASLKNNGMYTTPLGLGKKFSLIAVFTPTEYDATKKYRLQVTHLPFNFDGTQQLQLNPSELTYYTTKLTAL